jgi:DNA-binding transcriptional regulator YdaS (Cro superfamily)
MTLEKVQELIDRAIKSSGGKQSDLADRMRCAQQTVSKLRSGEIPMTAEWAARIARATNGEPSFAEFYPELVGAGAAQQVAS